MTTVTSAKTLHYSYFGTTTDLRISEKEIKYEHCHPLLKDVKDMIMELANDSNLDLATVNKMIDSVQGCFQFLTEGKEDCKFAWPKIKIEQEINNDLRILSYLDSIQAILMISNIQDEKRKNLSAKDKVKDLLNMK
jgi:hypothetical protein